MSFQQAGYIVVAIIQIASGLVVLYLSWKEPL